MALLKAIRQPDGVITNYHRVLFVQITTNRQNSIAVLSYVDEESREHEQADGAATPYKQSVTYETEYAPNMTIATAYEYLKTLPAFADAVDG